MGSNVKGNPKGSGIYKGQGYGVCRRARGMVKFNKFKPFVGLGVINY